MIGEWIMGQTAYLKSKGRIAMTEAEQKRMAKEIQRQKDIESLPVGVDTKSPTHINGQEMYAQCTSNEHYDKLSPIEQIQWLQKLNLDRFRERLNTKGVGGQELKAIRFALKELELDEQNRLTPDIPPMDPTYERARFLIDLATDGDYIAAAGGPIPDDILAVMRRYPAK